MKILFDTSVIIAALVESHPDHDRAFFWLKQARAHDVHVVVASHTVAELYAVLTTLPTTPRISPEAASMLIKENIEPIANVISLTAKEYLSTIKRLSAFGLRGGVVYDALIAKVAAKAKVNRLLTLNVKHFKLVWPEGEEIITLP